VCWNKVLLLLLLDLFLCGLTIEIIDTECVLDHESCLHFFSCVPLFINPPCWIWLGMQTFHRQTFLSCCLICSLG
jgi:hypothetical protein